MARKGSNQGSRSWTGSELQTSRPRSRTRPMSPALITEERSAGRSRDQISQVERHHSETQDTPLANESSARTKKRKVLTRAPSPPVVPADDSDMEDESSDEGAAQKHGRGKAKGVTDAKGMKVEVYERRIITTAAARTIKVLFHQDLKGAWTTFRKYPKDKQIPLLYKRFNECKFSITCSEEVFLDAFKQHIKNLYPCWMSALRKRIEGKTVGQCYRSCPEDIDTDVWCQLVDEWVKPEFKEKSARNKINRGRGTIVATTGSVPMAKYRKEELDRTGKEPSPIDMFKKFHVSKRKKGEEGEEIWPSQKAKELHDEMENMKSDAMEVQGEVDDWDIYKEVVGGPNHGRILGLGAGFDINNGDSQICNRRTCLEREESHDKLKEELLEVRSLVYELRDELRNKSQNNSNTFARSTQSNSVDNLDNYVNNEDLGEDLGNDLGNEEEYE